MNDLSLRQDILDEPEFEPSIDAANIGDAVENGIVTLSGHVSTYAEQARPAPAAHRLRPISRFVPDAGHNLVENRLRLQALVS